MLQEFVNTVKQEIVIGDGCFIFQDVPDLIVRKRYSRKDYSDIIKVVNKVKSRYLVE